MAHLSLTMARKPTTATSTATIGFEATALRGSAPFHGNRTLRSLKGNRWFAADSRSAAETDESNRSNPTDAAETSGATWTTAGSPKGWRGGAEQFYTPSCVVRLIVEMLAPCTALRGSAFPQGKAIPQVLSAAKNNMIALPIFANN